MNPTSFSYLADLLKKRSGIILSPEKLYLVETRLLPIARCEGKTTLDEFIPLLQRPGAEPLISKVIEAMTTNETFFFRDKAPFDRLVDTIVPAFRESRPDKTLRIWCAAASTGQEPYSIAIALVEAGLPAAGWRIQITGTDISNDVLEKARAGTYSQFEVQRGLPIQLLLKYFKQEGDYWQLSPDIKRMVQLKPFNLLDPYGSLGRFDIIFCRNVLIYFDRETKSDMLNRMAQIMTPDGFLILGAAETVVGITTDFEPMRDKRGIYMKTGAAQTVAVPRAMTGTPLRVVA